MKLDSTEEVEKKSLKTYILKENSKKIKKEQIMSSAIKERHAIHGKKFKPPEGVVCHVSFKSALINKNSDKVTN